MAIAVVPQGHPLRAETEDFISNVYRDVYGARIPAFAPTLVARLDGIHVRCAAGLRFEEDGFFSEIYLNHTVDNILSMLERSPVMRDQVFEVTSLASRSPADVPQFLREIVEFGETAEFDWAIFTATERLRRLLHRMKLPMHAVSAADPSRVDDAQAWGNYYAARPVVMAVSRRELTRPRRVNVPEVLHA